MIEQTLTHYDYIALQVFWETYKFFPKGQITPEKMSTEQYFLYSFFNKYQLIVITERGYRNKDQQDRMKTIISRDRNLRILSNLTDPSVVHSRTELLFNNDLRIITGQKIPVPAIPLHDPIAVMSMREHQSQVQKENRAIHKAVRSVFTHTRNGKVRSKTAREQLLEGATEQPLTKQEWSRRQIEQTRVALEELRREQQQALALALENLHEPVQGTNTQIDGNRVYQELKATRRETQKLIDMAIKKQNFIDLKLGDLPKWFKMKLAGGLKRLAIGSVLLPIWTGPKAIVNGVVIKPFKLVGRRVNTLMEIIQEAWGWVMVGFIIAGVCVFIYDDDYAGQRDELYQRYNTTITYLPVEVIYQPTTQTVKVLWGAIPGALFFSKTSALMLDSLSIVPGILCKWFFTALSKVLSTISSVIASQLLDLKWFGWGRGRVSETVATAVEENVPEINVSAGSGYIWWPW